MRILAVGNSRLGNGKRSVTRTIRLDDDMDGQLEKLADEQSVSVNSIITKALRKHLDWDVYAEKFGFTSLPTEAFEKMVNGLSEQDARALGHWTGAELSRDFMAFRFKRVDFDAALRAMEMLGPKYGKQFSYEHDTNGREHTVIVNHRMGRKATMFYQEAVRAMFDDLLHRKVDFLVSSDSQIVAKVMA